MGHSQECCTKGHGHGCCEKEACCSRGSSCCEEECCTSCCRSSSHGCSCGSCCECCKGNEEKCCSTSSPCCESEHPKNKEDWMIASWFETFHEVMGEVKKEILKSKIQKLWGPKLEKAADAVLEAAQEHMKSCAKGGEAKEKLREKLRGIIQGG